MINKPVDINPRLLAAKTLQNMGHITLSIMFYIYYITAGMVIMDMHINFNTFAVAGFQKHSRYVYLIMGAYTIADII